MLSQRRGGVERAERRIRLHLPYLLGVVGEMIGVREKDIRHKLPRIVHVQLTRTCGLVWEVPGQLRANGARPAAQRELQARAPREKSIDSNAAANGSAI